MKTTQLGNSRLLYVTQSQSEVDINQAIGIIDNFVAHTGQVEMVEEKIYIYPKGEGESASVWIGREIAGYPSQLPETIKMEDLSGTKVSEMFLSRKAENFSDLLTQAQSLSLKEGKALLRIVLDVDSFDAPLVQMMDKAGTAEAIN